MDTLLTQRKEYTLSDLRCPSPHFQRAINLKYDLGDADYIGSYIPTPNATQALITLLASTNPKAGQRAHLLHGAYGSGKSLFSTVLAAILSRDSTLRYALKPVLDRLHRDYPDAAEALAQQLDNGPRLLPVVLSGDEGGLASALGRALDRALLQMGLDDIRPHTVYQAALAVIGRWQDDYPATYSQLALWLEDRNRTRSALIEALEQYQPWAYQLFLDAYPHFSQ